MTQPPNTENKPSQGSAEAQPAQDIALSAGETSVQAMLSLVQDYNQNAKFFNEVLQPLMVMSDVVLPLAEGNELVRNHLISSAPSLDARVNALYGRVGLEIPAHLKEVMQGWAQSKRKTRN